MKPSVALVICNGTPPSDELLNRFWQPADVRIAADGGANSLVVRGRIPDYVVGDLDSLSTASRACLRSECLREITDQDTNDVTKVLQFCEELGVSEVHLLGVQGDRTDHFLACVDACYGKLGKFRMILWNETERMELIHQAWEGTVPVGSTVSLLPLFGAAQGITTRGLRYALVDATLRPGQPPCGVSNVAHEPQVHITIQTGCALLVTALSSTCPLKD